MGRDLRRAGWRCRPQQIVDERNLIVHVAEFEAHPGRRPLSRQELQAFFDHCDAQVSGRRALKRKGSLAALRDAALFKTMYGWGLRRKECAKLDVVDFARNPRAPAFRSFGSLSVRYGKALSGGPPRRRNVLTVFDWAVEVIEQYLEEIRPLYGRSEHPALWLTERGGRVTSPYVSERFATYRDELAPDSALTPHALRHSYVTHLIEDGFDPLFVQMQVGHRHASTTAIYTAVNGDFKQRALADALSAQTGERGGVMAKELDYEWRLRILLAEKGIFNSKAAGRAAGRARDPAVGFAGVATRDRQARAAEPARAGRAVRDPRLHPQRSDPTGRAQQPGAARAPVGRAGRRRGHRPKASADPRRQTRWLTAPDTRAPCAGAASAGSRGRPTPARTMASRTCARNAAERLEQALCAICGQHRRCYCGATRHRPTCCRCVPGPVAACSHCEQAWADRRDDRARPAVPRVLASRAAGRHACRALPALAAPGGVDRRRAGLRRLQPTPPRSNTAATAAPKATTSGAGAALAAQLKRTFSNGFATRETSVPWRGSSHCCAGSRIATSRARSPNGSGAVPPRPSSAACCAASSRSRTSTLDQHEIGQATAYLRSWLVTHDILEVREERLARFERWARATLQSIGDHPDHAHLAAYARWKLRPDFARKLRRGLARASSHRHVYAKLRVAVQLTGWLHGQGLTLPQIRQAHIDAWLAGTPSRRCSHARIRGLAAPSRPHPAHQGRAPGAAHQHHPDRPHHTPPASPRSAQR